MGGKGEITEVVIKAKVDRSNIGLINAILEGYEHVAIMRVVDKPNSIIEIYTSSHFEDTAFQILNALQEEYGVMIKILGVERVGCKSPPR